ncbi:MAG: copper chaperone PCu(A)C [Gemmatimonadetes bacterium]|nr:copper chaperone PCu(A)C [Gemmatimonadota bacterium]
MTQFFQAFARGMRVARHVAVRHVASLALLVLAPACSSGDSSLPLERMVVVIPVGNESAALYGTVRNLGAVDDTIVGIDVEIAERSALFSSREHLLPTDVAAAGAATGNRAPVVRAELKAGEQLRFSPDRLHALLGGLRRPLVRGDSTRVTVRFARGAPVSATARVIAYADLDSIVSPELSFDAVRNVASRFQPIHDDSPIDSAAVGPTAVEGRALYRANGCGSCHGPAGWGDGPVGKTLNPPPRDFRDANAFKNGSDVSAIAQTIATGIMTGGAMPRFVHLTNSERESIALYVLSLRTTSTQPVPPSQPRDAK